MFPKGDPDFPLTKQKNICCPSKVTYYLQHSLFIRHFVCPKTLSTLKSQYTQFLFFFFFSFFIIKSQKTQFLPYIHHIFFAK